MPQRKAIRISGHQAGVYVALIWVIRVMLIMPIILSMFLEPANGGKVEPQVLAIVAVPWLLFETWRLIIWCRTLWLIDHGNGFTIKTPFRSDDYDDDDVLMTSLSFRFIQPQISSETLCRRSYHLWLRQRKISMNSLVKVTAMNDALLHFTMRIEERQLQKAKAELESGGEITGSDRWTLTETALTVKDHTTYGMAGEQVFPLSELVGAKCTVDRVAVWSRDAMMPVLSVPMSSPNAPLLLQILTEKLARQPLPTTEELDSGDSLGRRIFVSRRGQKIGVHLAIIALITWICFIRRTNPDVVMVIGFFSVFYVIVGLFPAIARLLSPGFDIYENGIVRRGLFGKTTIFFDKMPGYAHAKDVMYYNGILCMSKVTLWVYWQDETGKTRCTSWRCRGRNLSHEFAEYDFATDELAEICRRKMWVELNTSGVVHWNDSIQVAPNGVHLTAPKGKAKKLGTVFVPFDQLRCKIDENGAVFGTDEIGILVPKGALNYQPGIRFIYEVAAVHGTESESITGW